MEILTWPHSSCGFSLGEEEVRGFKQYFFSSSNLPIFTKCVGTLETSVLLSVLAEGRSKSWETHTTHKVVASVSLVDRLQMLQSSQ